MNGNTLLSNHKYNYILVLFFAFLSVIPPLSSQASDMVVFERLAPLTARLNKPTNVTVDQNGRTYITETQSNRVLVLSQSGSHIHTITGLAGPISLAVDAGGRIYIGNRDRGNVEIYSPSFEFLFKLGQGDSEFGRPNDIEIAASGLIYVVDKNDSAIKLYNPDGTYYSSIGQSGNGDGKLHHPLSLVIDTATNELVVLDLQQQFDRFSNSWINGARIQFLEMNGTFKRGYTKFGYDRDNGELVMPIHIAVDGQSRVYVSDARLQKVMLYDNNGNFIGMIDSASPPLRTPLGIALGKTNKLYIASVLSGRVEVYGIGSYISLAVSPEFLGFEELQGQASGEMKSIVINNTGNSEFTWTASSSESWLMLPENQGFSPPLSKMTVNIGVDIDDLAPGQYQGSVTITAGMAAVETVTVNLTVLPSAIFSVSPSFLTYTSTVGTIPAAQILAIENGGNSTLNWNANSDQSWLTLNATSGTAPSAIKVYADTTSLPAGKYIGTITITNQGSLPEMKIIPVSLTLTEAQEPPEPPPLPEHGDNSRGKKWIVTQVLPGTTLNSIWGSSTKDLFVVGATGSILQYDGRSWSETASGVTENLYGVWGSSPKDVYAVGENGLVLHYNGIDWSSLPIVVRETLHDAWGSSSTDIYAVSRNGSIVEAFTSATDTDLALRGVWGSSKSDIFVVGESGTILHYNGGGWSPMYSDTSQWLNGVWGCSESDVFAVGENGTIVYYNGTSWNSMDSGTTSSLQSIWGSSCKDVFAVGANGLILYYNGIGWYGVSTPATEDLNDVWVSDRSEVFAVGENGTILFGKAKFPWILINNVLNISRNKHGEKDSTSVSK